MQKKSKGKYVYGLMLLCFAFIFIYSDHVQAAATHKITIYQYSPSMSAGDPYYEIYPNKTHYDYKKFMKYTYKISDDSIIGLKENANSEESGMKWISDKVGFVMPYNIEVHSLAPGTATLKVYDGSKLIDTYSFTVVAYQPYSPSSFVNDTYDASQGNITKSAINKQNLLIRKFAKIAADTKYTTTNQRIQAVINAISNYNKEQNISGDTEFNQAVLNNLGFKCIAGNGLNMIQIYDDFDEYENGIVIGRSGFFNSVIFGASDPEENYDFNRSDVESVYSKTHLPAWIIGEDTPIQNIDVGQTKSLSSCDLNENLYSSDTSIVTVSNGEITGVKPGYAFVYRYNDTYYDAFFVLVKNKGSVRTIKAKINTKTVKSYFKESDMSTYIVGMYDEFAQAFNWDYLRMFEMEPALGHGGSIKTKYAFGSLKFYLDYNGESTLLCRVGIVTD